MMYTYINNYGNTKARPDWLTTENYLDYVGLMEKTSIKDRILSFLHKH